MSLTQILSDSPTQLKTKSHHSHHKNWLASVYAATIWLLFVYKTGKTTGKKTCRPLLSSSWAVTLKAETPKTEPEKGVQGTL